MNPFNLDQLVQAGAKRRKTEPAERRQMVSRPADRTSRAEGPQLPGVAQQIAETIGTEKALYLIGQLPRAAKSDSRYPAGTATQLMLYVPKVLRADHFLVGVLGADDAQALVDVFGGECLTPPACIEIYRRFRDRSALDLLADGLTRQEVSDAIGISPRTVALAIRDRAAR